MALGSQVVLRGKMRPRLSSRELNTDSCIFEIYTFSNVSRFCWPRGSHKPFQHSSAVLYGIFEGAGLMIGVCRQSVEVNWCANSEIKIPFVYMRVICGRDTRQSAPPYLSA